jgi:hypothetical protein
LSGGQGSHGQSVCNFFPDNSVFYWRTASVPSYCVGSDLKLAVCNGANTLHQWKMQFQYVCDPNCVSGAINVFRASAGAGSALSTKSCGACLKLEGGTDRENHFNYDPLRQRIIPESMWPTPVGDWTIGTSSFTVGASVGLVTIDRTTSNPSCCVGQSWLFSASAATATSFSCLFGQFGTVGNCAACDAGSYCSTPLSKLNCTQGQFCPPGSIAPQTCASGSYCPAGASIEAPCSLGFYCPATAQAQPTACTAGSYCAITGLSTVSGVCSAGHYCPAGSSVATQYQCSSGNVCPAGSATQNPCLAGFFCSSNSFNVRGAVTGQGANALDLFSCHA